MPNTHNLHETQILTELADNSRVARWTRALVPDAGSTVDTSGFTAPVYTTSLITEESITLST